MELTIIMAIILMVMFFTYLNCTCNICRNRIMTSDRASNGRVRFSKRGTNLPVCRTCARTHPMEVE